MSGEALFDPDKNGIGFFVPHVIQGIQTVPALQE